MMTRWLISVVICMSLGCGSFVLGDDPPDDPEAVFDSFWESYDRYYAHFELKDIDWDGVYDKYRPQVDADTTDEELFAILAEIITILEDGHVYLVGDGRKAASHRHLQPKNLHFSPRLIDEHYLGQTRHSLAGERIIYGELGAGVGYIRLSTLSGGEGMGDDVRGWIEEFDRALAELWHTSGLVLDLRNNTGGRASNTVFVASRFATERKPFLVTRSRNGPAHGDFSAPNWWYISPRDAPVYDRPVVVVTNRRTFSAAEWLTLALRQFDHVRHVGTHTGGGLAMFLPRELPNGWMHTVSVQDTRCPLGRSYERVGVAPHRYQESDGGTSASKSDAIIEEAMGLIVGGW